MKNEINILATYQNIIGTKLQHLAFLSKGYWSHTGKLSLTTLNRWVFGPITGLRSIERFFASTHDWGANNAELISSFLNRLGASFGGLLGSWALATMLSDMLSLWLVCLMYYALRATLRTSKFKNRNS